MFPFAPVCLRRAWVFWVGLMLLVVPRVRDDSSRFLIAAETVGLTRSAGANLPLSFEPNRGQADSRVKFLSRGRGYTLVLTKDEVALAMQKPGVRSQKSELELKLLGSNPAAKVTGANELPGKSNYFIGNDPKKWHTNVPTYARVRYENVYPGVDLEYYGNQGGQLEYDFVVAAGADPGAIRLAIDAERQVSSEQKAVGRRQSLAARIQNRKSKISTSLHLAPNGDLIVALPGGELRLHKPVVYQTESKVDSRQSTVESRAAKEESRPSFPGGGISGQLQSPTEGRQRTTDHGPRTSANPKSKIQN